MYTIIGSSSPCGNPTHSSNLGGLRAMQYTKRPCQNCGEPTTNKKFCSRSCATSFNNRANPKRKPEHKCAECGKPITANRVYCKDCSPRQRDWSSVTIGELQDLASYQISARIRELARKTYRSSDSPKCCVVCGYDNHYEVCHRKPISSFDASTPVSVVNDLNNLVALCPNHHWELDNGILDQEKVAPKGLEPPPN